MALVGTKAMVADHTAGLDLIDVSDPAEPVLVESLFVEGFAKDVTTSGSHAYAVDMPTGFTVLDLSKAGPLQPVGALQTATMSVNTKLSDVATIQGKTLVSLVGGGLLQVIDVSNPAAPVTTTSYRTPGAAVRASLDGPLAFVAAGAGGLQVVACQRHRLPALPLSTRRPARRAMWWSTAHWFSSWLAPTKC